MPRSRRSKSPRKRRTSSGPGKEPRRWKAEFLERWRAELLGAGGRSSWALEGGALGRWRAELRPPSRRFPRARAECIFQAREGSTRARAREQSRGLPAMRFKSFPALLLLALALPAAAAERPNVLFILCDDLRPYALGCYGSPHVRTPNIDRLAAEGVRFQNSFCTTSLCSPSRASILTGLYAHHHGVRDNFTELPAQLPHWASRLHEAGYATAYLGKWHMGEENDMPRPGFDYFVTHKGQGKYFDTEWNVNGNRAGVIPGYYTTIVTDMALDWLKRDHAGKPWALCIGHKAPHSFYFPEKKYEDSFDSVRVPYPQTAFELDDKPAWIKERLYTWHGIYGPLFEWRKKFPDDRPEAVKDFENMVHAYWGTILSVDDSVARLVDYLKSTGELDRTIILLMGDNGLLEGEHGMVDKRTMHEPSIRIPLIVRFPPLTREPRVIGQQVLTLDIAPSILELCGAAPIE